ncbi:hypothetical protein ACA910_020983 [Epithemia clementina (nom. ined.)]
MIMTPQKTATVIASFLAFTWLSGNQNGCQAFLSPSVLHHRTSTIIRVRQLARRHSYCSDSFLYWGNPLKNFGGDSSSNNDKSSNNDGDGESFDLEAARQQLEDLLGRTEASFMSSSSSSSSELTNKKTAKKTHRNPFSLFDVFFRNNNKKEQENTQQSRRNTTPTTSSSSRMEDDAMYSYNKNNENNNINLDILDVDLRTSLLRSMRRTMPPLTAMEVERRQAEIQLLSQLLDSNDVVNELWNLWYQEQGVQGAAEMQQVEDYLATPNTWHKAENAIIALIQQYGTTWAEPINRLATLYYMQGRLQESEQLCLIVLSIKPWHFGALSGLVMVYASLQDAPLARQWAARRLPSLQPDSSTKNRRRSQWVQGATRQATTMLKQQLRKRKEWWGPKDSHYYTTSTTTALLELPSNLWENDTTDSSISSSGNNNNNMNNNNNAWQ